VDGNQVTRIQKLSKGGNFRAWVVHVRAWLTNVERWDQFLDRELDEDERDSDQQARARLVLFLANDMLPIVDGRETTYVCGVAKIFVVLQALRAI
jgi:hypothetical protein